MVDAEEEDKVFSMQPFYLSNAKVIINKELYMCTNEVVWQ